MYQINLNDKILYYPGSDDAIVYDTELNEEIGMAGELRFKVPSENIYYSLLSQGALVSVLKDDKEIWRGEIRSIKTDFNKVADVYALEDMAWLGDEAIAPSKVTNETYAQRFQSAIATYNSNRPAERQFTAGYLTNVGSSDDCNWTTEYGWSLLDCLRSCIAKDTGYIRVRRVVSGGTTTRYIDIVKLDDYGSQATQPIEYGYNLLDYVKDSDYGNLTNVLTPYGDELESEVYPEYSARLQGTTIADANSISIYGRHAKSVIFDNVSDINALNALAQSYITRYSQPQLTMEVQAVDLASIENVGDIKIGDSVRIIAKPFGIDQWLYLTQIRRDIQNVDKNTITLSGHVQTGRTLTAQTISTVEAIENLPSKSNILEAAKKNALEILNGENGGVIYFASNDDNQIIEQRIMNNADIEQATKAWRWNINGLAFMRRTYPSYPWNVGVAITMNGEIVADYITIGTMYADRIKGGTLTLGGWANENGAMVIRNAYGTEIGRWDANGISASTGTFSGTLNAASGTFRGNLSAAGGTFSGTLQAAYGTITDGTGTLRIYGGSLYISNYTGGGAGVFAERSGTDAYSCWGAVNSAARINGAYREVPTMDVIIAGNNASDERLKRDIKDIDSDFAEKLILGIKPKEFRYKDNPEDLQFGVIAQDILEIEEECGIDEPNRLCYLREMDDMYAVEYRQLIAPMIKVIQNQQNQISELQAQVNELVKIIKEGKDG